MTDPDYKAMCLNALYRSVRRVRGEQHDYENLLIVARFRGCTWREISERIGKPPSTVRDDHARALRRRGREGGGQAL